MVGSAQQPVSAARAVAFHCPVRHHADALTLLAGNVEQVTIRIGRYRLPTSGRNIFAPPVPLDRATPYLNVGFGCDTLDLFRAGFT